MHISDIVIDVVSDIMKRKETPELPTTLDSLDKCIWGLHRNELFIIGGRPSEGKTSLALQMAYNMSVKQRVVFISLEMTKEQLVERIICSRFSFNSFDMRSGHCKKKISDQRQEICDELKIHKLLIVDDTGRRPSEVEDYIKELSPKPDVIFIDHLQHISVRHGNRLEALDEYVRFLKTFAMRENVAIVLVSQLNRSAEDKGRPCLYHLKGCGSIEEVSDSIVLIWNHDNQTTLLVEKQRHGPSGNLEVNFIKEFFKFTDKSFRPEPMDMGDDLDQQTLDNIDSVQGEVIE